MHAKVDLDDETTFGCKRSRNSSYKLYYILCTQIASLCFWCCSNTLFKAVDTNQKIAFVSHKQYIQITNITEHLDSFLLMCISLQQRVKMNSIQLLFAFALTVIPGTLSVPTLGKVSFFNYHFFALKTP